MEEREKILIKIKNMIERTQHNGCTEAEALQAAMKVGEMMSKYDVSMSEVQFSNEDFITFEIKLGTKRTNFMSHMMMAIGRFTDTKCWISWYVDGYNTYRRYCFFGTKKDIMIAEYIYQVVENAINKEFDNYKKSDEFALSKYNGKTKRANFINGITTRISNRLQDMKMEMEMENEMVYERRMNDFIKESNDESIEEVHKSSIIVYDKFDIVQKKFKEKVNIKLSKSYSSRSIRDRSSYQSGVAAGDNVNIRKAVSGARSSNQKLIG